MERVREEKPGGGIRSFTDLGSDLCLLRDLMIFLHPFFKVFFLLGIFHVARFSRHFSR